jgi:hypothetical protein
MPGKPRNRSRPRLVTQTLDLSNLMNSEIGGERLWGG